VLVALVVGCGGAASPVPHDAPGSLTANVIRYGYGPHETKDLTYQPDVVLIEGGPEAIVDVSPNGLVWTMDGRAGGVRDLRPGKIMFAASEAVGRVLKVEEHGDERDVTLAPVRLTDVIRDGRLTLDQDVDLAAMSFQGAPDLPGAFEESPGLALMAATEEGAHGTKASHTFGAWEVTAYKTATSLGLKAERGLAAGGLKIVLDAHFTVADLHVSTDVPISAGQVGHSGFRLTGITGFAVDLKGGAGNGLKDNRKVKIEFPIELKQPVLIGGFPATLTQKFKFLVETAFSARNGNLGAHGSWTVDGPLGFDGTNLTTPTITAKDRLVDSLAGVSVGINSVVAAVSFEFGLQAGLPVAGAGPYARLVTAVTLLNGSSIGIVQCRQTTIDATLKAGVAINVYSPVKAAIKKLFGYDIPAEKELLTKQLLKLRDYAPKVAVCS
jgi:hypothetical protein